MDIFVSNLVKCSEILIGTKLQNITEVMRVEKYHKVFEHDVGDQFAGYERAYTVDSKSYNHHPYLQS